MKSPKTNFWQELPKPFFVLAPMDDVTDSAFRRLVATVAAPDVYFTEFGNVTGMQSAGRVKVGEKFYLHPSELGTKTVAQLWGNNPDHFYQTAKDLRQAGFVGFDINMGCPEKNIVSRGCCSGLINNPTLAAEIIAATKDGSDGLPVSVKTRIGFKTIITEEWLGFLLGQDLTALTIHGRTQKEMSKVPAHWDEIGKAVALRNKLAPQTILIGNGDVLSRKQGLDLAKQYSLDGIMIGRGIFHDPWIFSIALYQPTINEKLATLIHHIDLHWATWGDSKSFFPLKRFFKIYVSGFAGASELRQSLMETTTHNQAKALIQSFTPPPHP